jgi:RNA polymerase sigma factor (sigma-70 family)
MSRADETQSLCSTVVRELMADHDWRLLPEEVFVSAVLNRLPAQQMIESEPLRKWCINTYCQHALHPACLGTHGPQKRKRAFEELATYLYRLAYSTWPQVAEDATQEALIMIYDKVEHCHNPGAFLAFAIQQLRDAARKYTRVEASADSLDVLLEQDIYADMPADAGLGTVGEGVEETALYADLRREVAARIKEVQQQNPKARRQLDAVGLRYFRELSNAEIAAALETTPENVAVLINRGLNKLREDERLWELAEEILQR